MLAAIHESTLTFWDATTADPVGAGLPGLEPGINTEIAFLAADGSQVATLAGGKVQLWERDRQSRIGKTLPVEKVYFPSAVEIVVTVAASPSGGRVAWLIDLPGVGGRTAENAVGQEGESIAVLETETGAITTLAPEGDNFALNDATNLFTFQGEDRIVTDTGVVLDVADGSEIADATVECFEFGATVSTGAGGLARCEGGLLVTVDPSAFDGVTADVDLTGAVVSDDGSHLAAFDPGRREATIYTADASPVVIDLSTDPALLVAVDVGGTDRPVLELSPDGALLVAASWQGGDYSFWRVDGGSLLLSQPRGRIQSIAFSPDGRLLALDLPGGGIEIRNSADLGIVTVLDGDGDATARSLLFLPEGKLLVEATVGGGLTLWDLDPDSWVRIVCDAAGRTLTGDERRRLVPDGFGIDPCEAVDLSGG